jgi:pilus assembly protein CpaB
MISLITIPNGATITQSKLGKADALAIPRRLAAGLRAVSISIDRVKGVAGLVTPGDRVDVIAVPPRVGNETPRATAIIRGALVLAMGAETEVARATPAPDQNLTTVTLAVTPQQADLIALADVNTTLRLALRPPEESIRAFPTEELQLGIQPQIETSPTQEPTSGRQSTMMAQSAVVVQRIPTPVPIAAQSAIEVIEGDRFVNLSSQRP